MVYRLVSLAVVLLLTVGACSGTDDVSVDGTTVTSATAAATTTIPTTETPTLATAPSTTQAAQTESDAAVEINECQSPLAATDSDSEAYVELQRATETFTRHTNEFGATLLAVEDFSSGWENQASVASIVAQLLADLEVIERVSAGVLIDAYGAFYDEEAISWVFPESMWPLPPGFGYLEELAMAPALYRDDILPLMFSMPTLHEAVNHWNHGASPCGYANGMIERLHGARSVISQ